MNTLDIVFALILGYGLISGFVNGFIKSIANFVGIGLAIWIGINFSNLLEFYIVQQDFIPEDFVKIIAFIVTILLVILGVKLVAKILHSIVHTIGLGFFNRLLGAIFGVLLYALGIAATSYYLLPFFSDALNPNTINNSILLDPMLEVVELLKISLF